MIIPIYKIKIAASTNIGLMRKNNEDNYLAGSAYAISGGHLMPGHFQLSEGAVMAVADGIGGSVAGEVASSLAMSAVQEFFMNLRPIGSYGNEDINTLMSSCISDAAFTIREHTRYNPQTSGMGTTIVLAWLLGSVAYISWCGDSRAYLFRKKDELVMLTSDHNLLQELIDEGSVSASETGGHPAGHILTRFLGDTHMKPQPDFVAVPFQAGDIILLCTDGLNGMLPDSEIKNILVNNPDIDICIDELINAANRAGGYDNITVVLAEIFS